MKLLVKLILACCIMYMALAPFLNKQPRTVVQPVKMSTTQVFAKEIPKHNVKLPDFAAMRDIKARKRAFFALLKPYVVAQNKRILVERETVDTALTDLELGFELPDYKIVALEQLLERYQISARVSESNLNLALNRIDGLPLEMVLTQAANESGWGTSRFARMGLNFFGLWCFKPGCGLVPNQRNQGSHHEVAAFTSLEDGIAAYFKNINTHRAYQSLRDLRQSNRDEPSFILAGHLLAGLGSYSERGQDYINELNQMMVTNQGYFGE